MKTLMIIGVGLAAYGGYLWWKQNQSGSSCGCAPGSTTNVTATKTNPFNQLYPDSALKDYGTKWGQLFNTPARLGIDDATMSSAEQFVRG